MAYRLSPAAEADVDAIIEWLAPRNKKAAQSTFEGFIRTFRLIGDNPEIGTDRSFLSEGLRMFPVGRHVLYYRRHGDGVMIIRVIHASRDLAAIFGKDDDQP